MCNCNQKRAGYTSGNTNAPKGMVKVQLTEHSPMVVNGDITGRMYVFRSRNDVNWVDARDAQSMKDINGLQVFY